MKKSLITVIAEVGSNPPPSDSAPPKEGCGKPCGTKNGNDWGATVANAIAPIVTVAAVVEF